MRRELAFAAVGLIIGIGTTSAAFLVFDGSDGSSGDGGDGGDGSARATAGGLDDAGGGSGETTEPPVDPTDTEFGELTEESEQVGVRVRWAAELREGPDAGTASFVTAHDDGRFALLADGVRIVEEGDEVTLCGEGTCSSASVDEAAGALSGPVRPFYRVLRIAPRIAASDEYEITGETELGDGIFQQCGQFDPAAFDLSLPDGVVRVTQCLDVTRGAPLAVDLIGEQTSVGTASLQALADARPSDFSTE